MPDESSDTHDTQNTPRIHTQARVNGRSPRETTLDYYIESFADAWAAGEESLANGWMTLACELSFEEGVRP